MSAVAKVISKLSHFLVKHSDMEYAGVERGGVGEKMSGPLILSGEFWKRETFLTSALTQNKTLEVLPDSTLSFSLLISQPGSVRKPFRKFTMCLLWL